MRGEAPDSQLAEVRVVLRDSEDTARDGYWANAEDVVSFSRLGKLSPG